MTSNTSRTRPRLSDAVRSSASARPATPSLVEVSGLTKVYGSFTALHPTDLRIERGEIFGLLGPNGAGKSTLIRTLMGFLTPTGGSARIDGFRCDVDRIETHRRTAYLPGEVRLFHGFRGREIIDFFAKLRGDADSSHAFNVAERLEVDVSRKVQSCSSGMRQKLALSVVLSAKSPLVILDEPTTHLDPTARLMVLQLAREIREDGRTVLFSSHVFSEVEDVCDRAALLRAGRIVERPVIAELRKRHRITAVAAGPLTPPERSSPDAPIIVVEPLDVNGTPGAVRIDVHGEFAGALAWLSRQSLSDVRIEPYGLQQVYEAAHGTGDPDPGP